MQQVLDKIPAIKADVTKLLEPLKTFKVTNADDQSRASEVLGQIKKRLVRIEELRVSFTKPLLDQKKFIDNTFKVEAEPLLEAEARIKSSLKAYVLEERRKAEAEADRIHREQALAEARAKAEAEKLRKQAEEEKSKKKKAELEKQAQAVEQAPALVEAPVVEAPARQVRTSHGVTSYKDVWKWEVENEATLRKAHPELFILDRTAVNKLISSGERTIAGLRIYKDVEVAQHA